MFTAKKNSPVFVQKVETQLKNDKKHFGFRTTGLTVKMGAN